VAVIDEAHDTITLFLRLAEMRSDKSFIAFIRHSMDPELPNQFAFRPDGIRFSKFLISGNGLFDVCCRVRLGRSGRRRHEKYRERNIRSRVMSDVQ
jgi:hypothetical protein